jgi:predicted amidohydrolase
MGSVRSAEKRILTNPRLTIALGEYDTGWHDPATSLASAARLARSAARAGADVIVLPETATTGFTMDTSWAVPIDAPEIDELRRIARESKTWLIAGVALRGDVPASGVANAALAIDPSGTIAAVHRKQRLFAYGDENAHYTPGSEPTTVTIGGTRLGLFICYELRFPEVFAPVAPEADAMVVIANWPSARLEHWDVLLRARAIENQCYAIGVNRLGVANGLEYTGGSTAFDPWGDRVAGTLPDGTRMVAVDTERVASIRARYPFLKDRCIEGPGVRATR